MEAARTGDLLRSIRMKHGLSQESLAIRARTSREAIVDIEEGRVSPSVDFVRELLELQGEDLVLRADRRVTGVDLTLNQANLALSPEHRLLKGLAFADLVRAVRSGGAAGLGRSLRPGPIFGAFEFHRVAFVVIGSIAGLIHGSAYPTYDLDVAYAGHLENRERLASALSEIGVRNHRETLGKQRAQSFDTQFGTLDVLCEVPGVECFEHLWVGSVLERIAGFEVRVASLDHLIAMKRAANRVKDQLMVLEYIELADEIRRREEGEKS